jgi:hypothetical protein
MGSGLLGAAEFVDGPSGSKIGFQMLIDSNCFVQCNFGCDMKRRTKTHKDTDNFLVTVGDP